MFSPSVYDDQYHNMDLIPPSNFVDQHGHELPGLLLSPSPVDSSGAGGGPQCAPLGMSVPRDIGPSSPRSNARPPPRKDRHSKISTAQGLRDRRVRLSVGISRRFFDLQDMLGFDKASKTLEWLLGNSADSIEKLARTSKLVNNYNEARSTSPSSTSSFGSLDHVAMSANGKEKKDKPAGNVSSQKSTKTTARDESRAKARARARERTREKLLNGHFRALSAQSEGNAHNLLDLPSHKVGTMGEQQASRCELQVTKQSTILTRGKPSSILGYHHETLVISSSKDGNYFNNVDNFFPNLHQQRDISIVNMKADLMSMDNLEKLIAANELN